MDRITEIWIRNFRSLADVRLRLDGLTALVGENAGGKSTLLEALEILRRTTESGFVDALYNIHGGALGLFRDGTNELVLGARISDSTPAHSVQYELVLAKRGHAVAIRTETIERVDETASRSIRSMERKGQDVQYDGNVGTSVRAADSILAIPLGQAEARRVASCLGDIAVHMEFDVLTLWACHVAGRESALRGSTLLKPADRLELAGRNLASVYFKLRNEFDDAHWAQTMDYVRLGLGDQIVSVNTRVDPAGGNVALELKLQRGAPLSASQLSDGQLTWLAFVAIYRLSKPGELLAFDEPELHLHPNLLFRVVEMFEELAKDRPVVLATHSDRLLDFLHAPEKSVVVCELDENRATRLLRPDAEALRGWMERYSGYGEVRAAGFEGTVVRESDS